ncbi:MAG: adenosine deaminase [Acidimicrobiia bacterium]|nr:adenosine deaminase [Acidimicrobiia bacterium]
MEDDLDAYITALPKAELHVHIEGTLEPELMFQLAARNRVELHYPDVESLRAAYQFTNLQNFLDIYYQGASVLLTEEDFADLMSAYLQRAIADGVTRAEIFFDPQTHTARGVPFSTIMAGLKHAQGHHAGAISSSLILCFLRHLPEADALVTLTQAEPFLDQILAVGLDSSEVEYPPENFASVFSRARSMGLRTVAHAGEEGPPDYIWSALDVLGAERIDHGVRCLDDPNLVRRLIEEQTPLTVCPQSNVRLRVVDRMEEHPLPRMLEAGLNVSIHSDDPAYFGGYIGDNYRNVATATALTREELSLLAQNSLDASFPHE